MRHIIVNKEHQESLEVLEEDSNQRIDSFFNKQIPSFSRHLAGNESTHFYINGKDVKKSKKVKQGDTVKASWIEESLEEITPTDIPLTILYEDEDILVINKEQGMVVHPGNGNTHDTLVHALLYHLDDSFKEAFNNEEQQERPGIVHRLDKETSGVLVIAKTYESYVELSRQFKNRETIKYYIALVKGRVEKRTDSITTNIVRNENSRTKFTTTREHGIGKEARTDYRILKYYEGCSFVRIQLFTGRTHQIRVHFASIGHPVVGDTLYSRDSSKNLMMLHALSLEFNHPTKQTTLKVVAPLPERFKEFIKDMAMCEC